MEFIKHRPRIILVSGPPGCGKSTLSRRLVQEIGAVWLDKDCIDELFSPGDRGERYTREIEPKVLQALLNLGEINLQGGRDVILDVPWTHILLNNPEWIGKIQKLTGDTDAKLFVIECHLSEEVLRERLSRRGLDRDQIKLTEEGWTRFKKRDRIGAKNPLPHCLIDVERSVEESVQQAIEYLKKGGFTNIKVNLT